MKGISKLVAAFLAATFIVGSVAASPQEYMVYGFAAQAAAPLVNSIYKHDRWTAAPEFFGEYVCAGVPTSAFTTPNFIAYKGVKGGSVLILRSGIAAPQRDASFYLNNQEYTLKDLDGSKRNWTWVIKDKDVRKNGPAFQTIPKVGATPDKKRGGYRQEDIDRYSFVIDPDQYPAGHYMVTDESKYKSGEAKFLFVPWTDRAKGHVMAHVYIIQATGTVPTDSAEDLEAIADMQREDLGKATTGMANAVSGGIMSLLRSPRPMARTASVTEEHFKPVTFSYKKSTGEITLTCLEDVQVVYSWVNSKGTKCRVPQDANQLRSLKAGDQDIFDADVLSHGVIELYRGGECLQKYTFENIIVSCTSGGR